MIKLHLPYPSVWGIRRLGREAPAVADLHEMAHWR